MKEEEEEEGQQANTGQTLTSSVAVDHHQKPLCWHLIEHLETSEEKMPELAGQYQQGSSQS